MRFLNSVYQQFNALTGVFSRRGAHSLTVELRSFIPVDTISCCFAHIDLNLLEVLATGGQSGLFCGFTIEFVIATVKV